VDRNDVLETKMRLMQAELEIVKEETGNANEEMVR
jgi:hypothetical protein